MSRESRVASLEGDLAEIVGPRWVRLRPSELAAFRADASDPRLAIYARLLLGQAHLADSGQLPDSDSFSRSLADLMLRGV